MDQPIKNRVVVVTGAGSGFGQLISQKCAALGAKVVCADINEEGLAATIANITENGGEAVSLRTDVTRIEEMHALAAKAVEEFGAIDVMVNNAGTMPLAFYSDHAVAMDAEMDPLYRYQH